MVRKRDIERIFSRLDALETRPNADGMEGPLKLLREHTDAIRALTADYKELLLAVGEGIERTERVERRVRASVARARKELSSRGFEDPALEAEAYNLQPVDGDGSNGSGLRDVREVVEPPTETPSSIRGISLELMRRVYQ